MIIGFDGSRAFSKERTGTENYSYQLLLHLAKIDRENTYIVYLRPGVIPKGAPGSVSRSTPSAVSGWPSNFSFKVIDYPRLWTQLGLALQTFRDPLDVLFVPSHTLPLIRRPGLKTVMTVHDLGAEYLPKMHQLKQRLYLGFITKVQLKGATKLIAVSKATKEDLIKKVGVDSKRVEVVYEAVNTEIFKPVNSVTLRNVLRKFDIEKENYFLFVGTIQPRKNLERLIRAFQSVILRTKSEESLTNVRNNRDDRRGVQNDDLKLILAGGKGWLSEQIFELPKKLGIEDKVKFLGRVSDEELSALLTGARALVFPSLFEGFGLPILESFACNCPVLTSKLSSMPEVGGEAAVYVDPYQVESINEGMKKIKNKELRIKLIKKGKEQLKKFSWEKAARETLRVLEEAI